MNELTFYSAPGVSALLFACKSLSSRGLLVREAPSGDVNYLLLPVPSFDEGGNLKGGGDLGHILAQLPQNITVAGGHLNHPALTGRNTIDLLCDPLYLGENAAITADCAIRIAGNNLPTVFRNCPVLVIGWGRIGKCLSHQLKALGADVTVAARKESDQAAALSLGFHIRSTNRLNFGLSHYRVIFNTVPAPVLSAEQTVRCREGCILIDLASTQGIFGSNVIWARGLPGRDAPEASGELIARSVLRRIAEQEEPL